MNLEVQAQYRENEGIRPFKDNPLIATLPSVKSNMELTRALSIRPEYKETDRLESKETRLLYCGEILRFYQPCLNSLKVAQRLDSCLRWGYVNRNPLLSKTVENFNAVFDTPNPVSAATYDVSTYGFTVLGISGGGKTATLNAILRMYPQVVCHEKYQETPLYLTQIVWLRVQCAADGSLKGLCYNILREFDTVAGTDYLEKYAKRNSSLDLLQNAIIKLAQGYYLGVLVIDELQQLCNTSGKISATTLNFFVNFVNSIGVPVIFLGTGAARVLFELDFQQARRGSGKGEIIWTRMKKDSEWNRFLSAMWTYQYTRKEIPLTQEMNDIFYELSAGIPYIAVHLYDLVQEYVITRKNESEESFNVEDVRVVAADMQLTSDIIKKLQSGIDVNLEKYLDISPYEYHPPVNLEMPSNPAAETILTPEQKRQSNIDIAIERFAELFQIDKKEARNYIVKASLALPSGTIASYQKLFRDAVMLYNQSRSSTESPSPTTVLPLGNVKNYDDLSNMGYIDAKVGN